MSNIFNNEVTLDSTTQLDAFGRLRTSTPLTLFDSKFLVDDQPLYWGEITSGAGFSLYLPNESSINLTVGTASGDRVLRRTYEWFRYQPAKSLLIFNTFVLGTKTNNITKRVGYFSDDDGVFLEQTGSDLAFVLRTSTSGTASDARRITQTGWNIDTFDGTGPSGITLDDTQAQILFMDMEWLGVGRVRVGFVIEGKYYLAHEFQNANQVTSVYMKRASLPLSYEIVNTGTSSGGTLKQICSSVISEGGYNEQFSPSCAQRETFLNIGVGTLTPLVSIRLRSGYERSLLQITDIIGAAGVNDNNFVSYQLVYKPTLTGASFTQLSDATEFDISATALTGGTSIAGTFTSANQRDTQSNVLEIETDIPITSDLDGTPHIVTLAAEGIVAVTDVTATGAINFREIY